MARRVRAIDPIASAVTMRETYVYLLASMPLGTLYVGVTNDLVRRVHEHRHTAASSFAARYEVHRLVRFEAMPNVEAAIRREKRIKKWPRAWKVNLIEAANPQWRDLYGDIHG